MRKHKTLSILFVFFSCFSIGAFAQSAPDQFSYSAIARDAGGNPLMNSTIGVQISLLEGALNGPVVYQENHTLDSDGFGRLSLRCRSLSMFFLSRRLRLDSLLFIFKHYNIDWNFVPILNIKFTK